MMGRLRHVPSNLSKEARHGMDSEKDCTVVRRLATGIRSGKNLSSVSDCSGGGRADGRVANHQQRIADHRKAGTWGCQQLSSRAFDAKVVDMEIVAAIDRVHPGTLGSRGSRGLGGRRYGRRASGKEGLRKRLSSRRSPLDPLDDRLSLGTQMGRTGDPREISFCPSALGAARDGRLVSQQVVRRRTRAAASHAGGVDATDVGCDDPLVSRAKMAICRRWRLRHALLGSLLSSPSKTPYSGKQILSGRKSVRCSAASDKEDRQAAQTRPEASLATNGCLQDKEVQAIDGLLVWWWPTATPFASAAS